MGRTKLTRRSFLEGLQGLVLTSGPTASRSRITTRARTEPIRAAMVGTGHPHAEGKLDVLRRMSEYEFVGACEPDEELRSRQAQATFFQGVVWLQLEELLEDKSIKLVVVEGRVSENLRYARQAVHSGKHVHLEKPPGVVLEELRSLLKTAGSRDLLVQIGYQWRYNLGFQTVLNVARQGWLGDIYRVRGVVNSQIQAGERSRLAEYSGGMMFELGCHLIDRIVDLLGEPHVVQSWLRRDSDFPDALADNTLAALEYDTALATVSSSALQPMASVHRRLEILGMRGTAVLQPFEPPRLEMSLEQAAGPYEEGRHEVRFPENRRYVGDFRSHQEIT